MLRSINFFENFTKIIRFLDISFKFLKRKCAIMSIKAILLATLDFGPLNSVCEDSVKDSTLVCADEEDQDHMYVQNTAVHKY